MSEMRKSSKETTDNAKNVGWYLQAAFDQNMVIGMTPGH